MRASATAWRRGLDVLTAAQDGVYESLDGGKRFSECLPVSATEGH
ncbi:hypothetical protein [Streptomyces sp. NPDC018833]